MLDFIFSLLLWAVIGALPGFYATYAKRYDPRLGAAVGAVLGIIIGEVGIRTGIVASVGSGVVILMGLGAVAALLLPRGTFFDDRITMTQRINFLAYALTIPTVLIVMGIVVFPLVWNLIFSLRPISVGDLANVELFDLSTLTLDNFESQMGFRIDALPCEPDPETGECTTDARRFIGTDYRGYRQTSSFFLGDQYYTVGVRNTDFYPMIGRTLLYTLASTIFAILTGLVAALLVRESFPGRNIFRGFILFPYIAPVISVAFIWQALLRNNGLVNSLLDTNTSFLSTNETFAGVAIPLLMVILFQTWRYFPFAFLFLLARIQAIPDDIYEAAKVDGASPVQRLIYITLPQLRAVFGTLFLLRFIWTFNKFDDVYLLTGTLSSTKVIPVGIFDALFTQSNVGQASAIAVVMAVMLAIILAIYFRFFMVEEG